MSRLHADPVEVRTQATEGGPEPEQFLWRGRRYVVHEVLARWTSAGSWWKANLEQVDDGEREWWRVLARSRAGHGTYDLCFSWSSGWALRRVMD